MPPFTLPPLFALLFVVIVDEDEEREDGDADDELFEALEDALVLLLAAALPLVADVELVFAEEVPLAGGFGVSPFKN